MAYEYESPFFAERTYDARMNILEGGGSNSNWIYAAESENDTNASEETSLGSTDEVSPH